MGGGGFAQGSLWIDNRLARKRDEDEWVDVPNAWKNLAY